jgi:hypothetical protein
MVPLVVGADVCAFHFFLGNHVIPMMRQRQQKKRQPAGWRFIVARMDQ